MTSDTTAANAEIPRKSSLATSETLIKQDAQEENSFLTEIKKWINVLTNLKWFNIIVISSIHFGALYGLFTLDFTVNIRTIIWYLFIHTIQGLGLTASIHRYWTHRAYKAKFPLQIILLICFLTTGQDIFTWVRDHRVHHKYSDTNADPHNRSRGFLFSHIGWLFVKKHPEVVEKGREIDLSDLKADPVFMFGAKNFWILSLIFGVLIPLTVPIYGWHETWATSMKLYCLCFVIGWNSTWSVNSFAHTFGARPYNMQIRPAENKTVSFFSFGEGWHNYHHTFPWDYKASELGGYKLSLATMFIDFCAKIGWAYDLQQPSKELIKAVIMKKTDGSHKEWDAVSHPDKKMESAFISSHKS